MALVAFAAIFGIWWWSGKWQHDCYMDRLREDGS